MLRHWAFSGANDGLPPAAHHFSIQRHSHTSSWFSTQQNQLAKPPKNCRGNEVWSASFGYSMSHIFRVGGLEHVLFSHMLGIIIPIDFHFFQRSRYTTNQSHLFPFSACKNPNAQGRTSGPPLGSPCHVAKTETQRMLLGCGCVALQGTQIPGSYGCSIWYGSNHTDLFLDHIRITSYIYIYIYGLHVIIENGVHWHILGSYGVAIMDIFFLPWALVDMFSPLPQLGLARILVTDGTDTQSSDLEVYGCLVVEHDWLIFPEILGNFIIPIDEFLIFFRGVGWKTTNQNRLETLNHPAAEFNPAAKLSQFPGAPHWSWHVELAARAVSVLWKPMRCCGKAGSITNRKFSWDLASLGRWKP